MKRFVIAAILAASLSSMIFAASGRVELLVWESSGTEQAFIQYAIREYKKVNPKVKIYFEPVESTDARNKIELDGPAGVGADIFVAPHDHIGALVAGQHILPVEEPDEYMADFMDLAREAATYEGVVYGYPLGEETYVMFYNKDILPKPLTTWEEIIEFSKSWNVKIENKYALTWSVTDPYYDYMFLDSFGAPLFGPKGNDPKQHNINSAAAIAGFTYFQKLRKLMFNIPAMDASRDFCHASFLNNNSPMVITGSWKINEFKKAGKNFGITTLPKFPGSTKPATSFSGARLAFVSSYTDQPEEAMAFAKFLTSKEMLQKRFEMTDQIPPRKDISVTDPLNKAVVEQLKYSKTMPTITQLGTFWQAMGPAVSGIWEGDDVKTTLNIAAQTIEAAK